MNIWHWNKYLHWHITMFLSSAEWIDTESNQTTFCKVQSKLYTYEYVECRLYLQIWARCHFYEWCCKYHYQYLVQRNIKDYSDLSLHGQIFLICNLLTLTSIWLTIVKIEVIYVQNYMIKTLTWAIRAARDQYEFVM